MKPANKIRLFALVISLTVLSVIGLVFFSNESSRYSVQFQV